MAEGPDPPTTNTAGTRVKKEALPKLLNLLSPVAHSWDLFAQQIGVPSTQISQIKEANPQTGPNYLYRCFTQALEWWVANHDNPVYESIINVLDPGIGKVTPAMNRALANELREFVAKQRGPTTRGETSKSSYWEGGASKPGIRSIAVDNGTFEEVFSEFASAMSPTTSSSGREATLFPMAAAGTHTASPGLQGAREVSLSSSETVSLCTESTTGSVSGSDHEAMVPRGQNDTSSSFPYLDTRKLSMQGKLALQCRLLEDSDKIMDEFNDLTHYTIKSIVSSCVSVKELHTHLSGLGAYKPIHKQVPLLRDQLDEIERAENVMDVFNILQKYYSLFNYRIIEKLIGWFGTPEDKKRLENYIENFKRFCKRMTFECPPDIFGPVDKDKTNIVVKVEESWGPTEGCPLDTVLRLRISLGNILEIEPSTLNLCRIDEGCIELLFQVPSFIEDIFPLSREQERSLTSVGVTRLTCGSYSFPQPPKALVPQMAAQAGTQELQPLILVSSPSTEEQACGLAPRLSDLQLQQQLQQRVAQIKHLQAELDQLHRANNQLRREVRDYNKLRKEFLDVEEKLKNVTLSYHEHNYKTLQQSASELDDYADLQEESGQLQKVVTEQHSQLEVLQREKKDLKLQANEYLQENLQLKRDVQTLLLSFSSSSPPLQSRPHHLPISASLAYWSHEHPTVGDTPIRSMHVGDHLSRHNIHLQQPISSPLAEQRHSVGSGDDTQSIRSVSSGDDTQSIRSTTSSSSHGSTTSKTSFRSASSTTTLV